MKKGISRSSVFALLARLILAGIFFYAGFSKLETPRELAASIVEYRILPDSLVWPLAVGLPIFECNLAIMLVLGLRLRVAALGITILCAMFTVAVAQSWARGLEINCSCFGEASLTPIYLIFLRDIALLALSLFLLRYSWKSQPALQSSLQHSSA